MDLKLEVYPAYIGDISMFPIKETMGELQYHPKALKMWEQREEEFPDA